MDHHTTKSLPFPAFVAAVAPPPPLLPCLLCADGQSFALSPPPGERILLYVPVGTAQPDIDRVLEQASLLWRDPPITVVVVTDVPREAIVPEWRPMLAPGSAAP